MIFETTRMIIRNFTQDDLEDMFTYCHQEEVAINAGWAKHKTRARTKRILSYWINEKDIYAIVYKENNKVIGHIAIDEDSEEGRSDTRELGFALNSFYHHKGIMTEVVNCIIEYLRKEEIKYVWACAFKDNIASQKLIEKCGFEFIQEGEFHSDSLDKDFLSKEYRIDLTK